MTDARFNIFVWHRALRADRELSSGAKLTLWNLSSYADSDGKCYPGRDTLAEDTGQSPSTITEHMKEARKKGWVKTTRRPNHTSTQQLLTPTRTSEIPTIGNSDDQKSRGPDEPGPRESRHPEVQNPDIRTSGIPRSYIRKNYPERTTQQNYPAAAAEAEAGEVQGDGSSPSLPAPPPTPAPAQGQVEVVQVKEVKAPQEERHGPAELRERWRRALVAANLSFVALPEGLLQQLLEASEERVEEALGSLHSGVRYPVTWARKILNGEAERPQRASPRHSDGGGDDIWTGGRNPRVKVTAINQPDNPYRHSGKPSIYVPPGLSLEGHGGEA